MSSRVMTVKEKFPFTVEILNCWGDWYGNYNLTQYSEVRELNSKDKSSYSRYFRLFTGFQLGERFVMKEVR